MTSFFDRLRLTAAMTSLATDVPQRPAMVWIVGAGPGDPDLLTVKALRLIKTADVIVYDRLVSRAILALASSTAERIFVGKTRGQHTLPQADINALLVAKAQAGGTIVRLKGGDPFIFGRGGEELDALREAGIDAEVVPGITAALGCAAQAQIALTHRAHAQSVTFVAGQCRDLVAQDWRGLAGPGRTLVIYMGLAAAADIARKLQQEGLAATTPVALIENGTQAHTRVLKTDLAQLEETVHRFGVSAPSLLVVGDVAAAALERGTVESLRALAGLGS